MWITNLIYSGFCVGFRVSWIQSRFIYDPQEALGSFEPGLYDLVILDIKMPKMDGFELYHEIKKDNNANVCFLTASELYYEEFRKKEYCALNRNLFIKKPIKTKIGKTNNKIINK